MDWIIFAFLAPVLWAGCNVIDKFLLTKKFKNPYSYQVWLALMDGFGALFFLMFFQISFHYPALILGIIIGIIDVISLFLYNKAMLIEEASRVIPLSYLNVLFILPMAYIFFGENIGLLKYSGILLLLAGAMLISYKKIRKGKWMFSPAVKLTLMIAFIWACLSIMEKYTLDFIDAISLLFWVMIGFIIGGLSSLYFTRIRLDFHKMIQKVDRTDLLLTILNMLFAYSAFILFLTAMSIGYVSLTVGIASIQPLIIFVYTTILTLFLPKAIKERIDKSTVFLKIIAIFLIILGSWLTAF